jgi:hypothetical protein
MAYARPVDSGQKAKVGLVATGGLLAALTGFVDDCGRLGARSAMMAADDVAVGVGVGSYGDDLARLGAVGVGESGDDLARLGAMGVGESGDDLARLGAMGVGESGDDLARLGASGSELELGASHGATWEELFADVGLDAVDVGLNASDLLLGDEESEATAGIGDPELAERLAALQDFAVENAAVAAMLPLYETASDDDRALRERVLTEGVSLLDAPSSLGVLLERAPRPLLVVARAGDAPGTMRAPDGSALEIAALMDGCRAARADCVVLLCDDVSASCVESAVGVANGALAGDAARLRALYRDLLRRRDDIAEQTARPTVYRIATTDGVARVVKSR